MNRQDWLLALRTFLVVYLILRIITRRHHPVKHSAFDEGTRVRPGLPSSKAAELGNAGLDVVTHLKMSFGGQYRSNEDAAT